MTFTGLKTYAGLGHGPLAHQRIAVPAVAHADNDGRDGREGKAEEIWKDIHETVGGGLIALIALHLCGVAASSLVHRENLILSMITGNKQAL
jgi:cytochrome b